MKSLNDSKKLEQLKMDKTSVRTYMFKIIKRKNHETQKKRTGK